MDLEPLKDLLVSPDPARMAGRGFLVAVLVTLVAPLVIESWSVSWPALRRWRPSSVAGLAVVSGVVAGATASTWLGGPVALVVGGASASGASQLVRRIGPLRLPGQLVPVLAASAAVVAGVRIPLTGVPPLDVAVTVLWLVGAPGALRLLDPQGRDDLRLTFSAVAAVVVVLVSLPASEGMAAAVGAAVAGSALAFVAGRRAGVAIEGPAWLVVGFLLSVAVFEAGTSAGPASAVLVPLLVWAVPLLDAVTAGLARARRGHELARRSGGHLVRRLRVRGLSSRAGSAVLVGAQLVLGAAAVSTGRGALPAPAAAVVGVLVVAGLSVLVFHAPVHVTKPRGLPRRMRWALAALVVGPPVLAAPAAVAMIGSRASLEAGRAAAMEAFSDLRDGRSADASSRFAEARERLDPVAESLNSPLASLGLVVPVVAPNLRAARAVVGSATDLAGAGQRLAGTTNLRDLRLIGGTVPLDQVREAGAALDEAAVVARAASLRVDDVHGTYLLPPVRRGVDELSGLLRTYTKDVETAAAAAGLLPDILGGSGPRRYFLAVQNTAEARATGGIIGNYAEVVAEGGRLRIERFGRVKDLRDNGIPPEARVPLGASEEYVARYGRYEPQGTWQNVNMAPDFPTVARVISGLYPQSGGRPLDGVIGVDPVALAAILEVTGPINAPGWPEKITSNNVVDVTLSQAYQRFAKTERIDFLSTVADKVVEALTTGDLDKPEQIPSALGQAARQRHVMVYFRDEDEQALMSRIGADGSVPPPSGSDSVLVVNQNAGANKLDYYLRRSLRYSVKLDPGGGTPTASSTLDVTLANRAPASGLDAYVIGPNIEDISPGENLSITSVYGELGVVQTSLDGRPLDMRHAREAGRNVAEAFLRLPAGSTRTLHVERRGRLHLQPGGWYTLDLLRQPTIQPDTVEVSVEVPDGWRVAEATGGLGTTDRRATGTLRLDQPLTLRVRVEPDR